MSEQEVVKLSRESVEMLVAQHRYELHNYATLDEHRGSHNRVIQTLEADLARAEQPARAQKTPFRQEFESGQHGGQLEQPAPAESSGGAEASAPGAAEKSCSCYDGSGVICAKHFNEPWKPPVPTPPPAAPEGECPLAVALEWQASDTRMDKDAELPVRVPRWWLRNCARDAKELAADRDLLRSELAAEKERVIGLESLLALSTTSLESVNRVCLKHQERAEQAEARALAAEDAAKGCFPLPEQDADVGVFLKEPSTWAAWLMSLRGTSGDRVAQKALSAAIERGPEGGDGWWVTREQARAADEYVDCEGHTYLLAVKLGIPPEVLAPETEESSDE